MTDSHHFRELEFLSLIENLNLVESMVEQLKTEFNFSEEMEANILVSLSEAVNNAIIHGNNSEEQKKVRILFDYGENEMTFIVEDEGVGFSPDLVKDPTALENLDKPTGRGIFLMRNLADRLEYLEGGRKVVISFVRN